jgi:hypothetical protein
MQRAWAKMIDSMFGSWEMKFVLHTLFGNAAGVCEMVHNVIYISILMTLIDHWIEKRSVPATMCQRMEQGKKG